MTFNTLCMSVASEGHKTISVRIPPELAEKLEEKSESSTYRVPQSEIVRAALREHLE
ncbi:ribbon-helix-helix domain-containing protein [Natrinema versiforme]|uniref:ribbon-helix-helix domain-containing protein n=1 Tax=Natrinema versiforme TaxID=88724 RepID=UPI0009FDF5ED